MKTSMTIVLFFSLSPTQIARANVMGSLKRVNKLPNTRVFIAAENGWLEVLELVAFLFKTGTCDVKNARQFFVEAIFCFVKICV